MRILLTACTFLVTQTVFLQAALAEDPPKEFLAEIATAREDLRDPWEGFNRRTFAFNETLDGWVLEPVGRGLDFLLPDPVQRSISNFFDNLRFPIVFGNHLFQTNFGAVARDIARFLVNTTLGVGGFLDPATSYGLLRVEEDFGQTLGWWGFPDGPYLVLPLFGPSSVRDSLGLVADYPLAVTPFFVGLYFTFGAQAVDIANTRSLSLAAIENAREASFDFYISARDGYLQRRGALVADRADLSAEEADDLYYFEEE